jgi:hypothetical protein
MYLWDHRDLRLTVVSAPSKPKWTWQKWYGS